MTSNNEHTNKRLFNQNRILQTLHYEGKLQRGELSNLCDIRKSSVTSIISDLIHTGLLRETEPGRYRSAITLNTPSYTACVANITPRNISFANVDLAGNITNQTSIPTKPDETPNTIIDILCTHLSKPNNGNQNNILGMGVAVPGIIDTENGLCIHAVNLNQWKNISLGQILSERLKTSIIIDNDVRCQLHACTWFDRITRHAENILYILIHDGISCALMSRGQIVIGEHFTAGEIGHTKAGDEGRLCACGRTDCLETYCSLPAIISEIHKIFPELNLRTASDIVKAADTTPAITNILNRISHRLALALTGIIAVIDPAAILLATADKTLTKLLRPHLQRHLYNEMVGLKTSDAEIITANNAENGTLRGIAAQVIQRSFQLGSF